MTIYSSVRAPQISDFKRHDEELRLFKENIDLILDRQAQILNFASYFLCNLKFASCGLAYVNGGGPLPLGYLLLGWNNRLLTEPCPDCDGVVLVTSFAGSILSGCNSCSGFCIKCQSRKSGMFSVHKPFSKRAEFIWTMRKNYPETISTWVECGGSVFDWGGTGLKPATKKRLVVTRQAVLIEFDELIQDLKSGIQKSDNYLDRAMVPAKMEFRLFSKSGATYTFPSGES